MQLELPPKLTQNHRIIVKPYTSRKILITPVKTSQLSRAYPYATSRNLAQPYTLHAANMRDLA